MPPSVKSLILAVHAHQPVGNFDGVFEEAHEKSYRPFFETLEKHPKIVLSCHFSGSLLDWLEIHKPKFLSLLKEMTQRGQLEFIGGGYYEPVYGVIPERDLLGQIGMMRAKLKRLFGITPEGAWLTERVWDPELVSSLAKARVAYTILDDYHFKKARVAAPVTGYYQTKLGKHSVDLFASMKDLRYSIPFRKAEEALALVHAQDTAGPEDVFVFADDCEKFGMWPSTYDWVYGQGWLEKFFSGLEQDSQITLYTFAGFRRCFRPKKTVRIPHASYAEMMEWSGGRFYNFFEKYPESRYMRERMWEVSRKLASIPSRNGTAAALEKARAFLYKAQCNCSYWHGVFGGLYLHHLRSAVFSNLIEAEKVLKSISKKTSGPKIEKLTLGESKKSVHWSVRQPKLVSFFDPAYGAALEELDFLPKSVNLMTNLARHKEVYHETVLKKAASLAGGGHDPVSIHGILGSKEENLERHLHYDAFRRLSFMDHVLDAPLGLEAFRSSEYEDLGDFANAPFRVKSKPGAHLLLFERKGQRFPLAVQKSVHPQGDSELKVHYRIQNPTREPLHFVWVVEFNFSIWDEMAVAGLERAGVHEWVLSDAWFGTRVRIHSRSAATMLAASVETVSGSESGLERTYQELGILWQIPMRIKAGGVVEESVTLGVL